MLLVDLVPFFCWRLKGTVDRGRKVKDADAAADNDDTPRPNVKCLIGVDSIEAVQAVNIKRIYSLSQNYWYDQLQKWLMAR